MAAVENVSVPEVVEEKINLEEVEEDEEDVK